VDRGRYSVRRDVELPANLPAHRVLLLIEGLLLALGDMAVVEFGHGPLFLANGVTFAVELIGLLLGNLAFL
jgi:hypothetical protein